MGYPFRISGRHRRFVAGLIPPNLNLDLKFSRSERTKSRTAIHSAPEWLRYVRMAAPVKGHAAHDNVANSGFRRWVQLIDATHCANFSAAICYCNAFRGRPLNWRAIAPSLARECTDRSVPSGRYCLSNLLVFSFEPRCHYDCGSQIYASTELPPRFCEHRPRQPRHILRLHRSATTVKRPHFNGRHPVHDHHIYPNMQRLYCTIQSRIAIRKIPANHCNFKLERWCKPHAG